MLMDCGRFFETCWGKNIYFLLSSLVAFVVFPQSYQMPFKVFCNIWIPSLTSAECRFLNKERNATFQSWVYGQIMSKISRAILQMIPISQWALVFSGTPGAAAQTWGGRLGWSEGWRCGSRSRSWSVNDGHYAAELRASVFKQQRN